MVEVWVEGKIRMTRHLKSNIYGRSVSDLFVECVTVIQFVDMIYGINYIYIYVCAYINYIMYIFYIMF